MKFNKEIYKITKKITNRMMQLMVITVIVLATVITSNFLGEGKTRGDLIKEDIRTLKKGLEIHHPDLYGRMDKEKYDELINSMMAESNTISESKFYFSLRKLLAMVDDGHTRLYLPEPSKNFNFLKGVPVTFRKFSNTWMLDSVPEEFRHYVGAEVLTINEVPIGDIIKSYREYVSIDNDFYIDALFSQEKAFYSFLEEIKIAKNNEPLRLHLVRNWQYEDIIVSPVDLKAMEELNNRTIDKEYPLVTNRTNENYRSTSLSNTVYYIQVNQFTEVPGRTFSDFTKKAAYDIGKGYYKAVIVDLRYNIGGDKNLIPILLKELKSLKEAEGFDVITLTSNETFSTGVTAAFNIRDELKSTIIGSPTGGNINSYTEPVVILMNNHKYQVLCSNSKQELLSGYTGGALFPNVEVIPTLKDVRYGMDTTIRWIMDRY